MKYQSAILVIAALNIACAHSMIEGTQIPDTDENREVIAVLTAMHVAAEKLDSKAITALISPTYFEDMGTSNPEDDYGYDVLVGEILPRSLKTATKLQIDMRIQDIFVEGDTAHADVRYKSRARLALPSGTIWDSHQEFNRVGLTRENGRWMITSGL